MENEDQVLRVTKIVEAKLGLYIHLAIFFLVITALIAVNLATNPERFWFQWPLIGWGAGLGLHAAIVLVCVRGGSVKAWMIAREMNKRARENQP
ncbi:MAG TPA: 2TM domain-containing protein [Gemmataceae bacterium]|nr:2TM domain-containing protein [Gemmataceae bacterium]